MPMNNFISKYRSDTPVALMAAVCAAPAREEIAP